MISDDGIGFSETETDSGDLDQPTATTEDVISQSTHLGIKGMRSRATLLGARLDIKSDHETGTRIKLFLKV